MADEKTPAKTPPRPAGAEPIRVASLYFPDGYDPIEIRAGERKYRTPSWIEIWYEPWHRHHRVRGFDSEGGRLIEEKCYPESRVAYYVPA